jgi:hypothetical protein
VTNAGLLATYCLRTKAYPLPFSATEAKIELVWGTNKSKEPYRFIKQQVQGLRGADRTCVQHEMAIYAALNGQSGSCHKPENRKKFTKASDFAKRCQLSLWDEYTL